MALLVLLLCCAEMLVCSSQPKLPEGWPAHMPYIVGKHYRPASMVIQHVNDTVGKGAFLKELVRQGDPIAEYTGRRKVLFHKDTIHLPYAVAIAKYDPATYAFDYKDVDGPWQMVVDAQRSGNESRFFNHSRTPNACFKKFLKIDPKVVFVVALEDLPAGTEVKVDYGDAYWRDKGQTPLEY